MLDLQMEPLECIEAPEMSAGDVAVRAAGALLLGLCFGAGVALLLT